MGWFGKSSAATVAAPKPERSIWPSVNDLIWIRLPCCANAIHPSRAEDIDEDGNLVVAAPSKPHMGRVPSPDSEEQFTVGWRDGSESSQVVVTFVEESEGVVPTWTVRAMGEARTLQRRQYVRAHWDRPLTVSLPGGDVNARIFDISEGGLRAVLPAMDQPDAKRFKISFQIDGENIEFDASVAWWGEKGEETVQVGLEFAKDDVALRERVRLHTFALQMEERRRQAGN